MDSSYLDCLTGKYLFTSENIAGGEDITSIIRAYDIETGEHVYSVPIPNQAYRMYRTNLPDTILMNTAADCLLLVRVFRAVNEDVNIGDLP